MEIVRKFNEKGYGNCVPEIVFWNLRHSRATPVPANQAGVALVSGFSKNLLTLFLEEGGALDPKIVMEAAISGKTSKAKFRKSRVPAGALLPHEIISAMNDNDGGQMAELQWKRMVKDLSKKGTLKSCLAICGLSEAMDVTALEASLSLGILVSELSEEPWKGKLITFSENPTLQLVHGDDLVSKTEFVRRMERGFKSDFQKVFDLILAVAVKGKLREDEMVKRVFVFSDMEFNAASVKPWETDYKTIVRKFEEKGYGNYAPEMVFWRVSDSKNTATPVPGYQKGAALVSGFSKNMMKLLLEGGDLRTESVMERAIFGEEYKNLVVID